MFGGVCLEIMVLFLVLSFSCFEVVFGEVRLEIMLFFFLFFKRHFVGCLYEWK